MNRGKEAKRLYDKERYQRNKEIDKPRRRAYYQKNKERIIAKQKERFQEKRELIYRWHRERNRKIREEVLAVYSGGIPKCARCGITDIDVLCIDHIAGGGAKERKEFLFYGAKWLVSEKGSGTACYQTYQYSNLSVSFRPPCYE